MSHGTHMNASCDGNVDVSVRAGFQVAADEGVIANITMSHVTHVNESWHTCEQVISQVTSMTAFAQALYFFHFFNVTGNRHDSVCSGFFIFFIFVYITGNFHDGVCSDFFFSTSQVTFMTAFALALAVTAEIVKVPAIVGIFVAGMRQIHACGRTRSCV